MVGGYCDNFKFLIERAWFNATSFITWFTDNIGHQELVEIHGKRLRMWNYCNNGYDFFPWAIMPEDTISSRGITFCISFKNLFSILTDE